MDRPRELLADDHRIVSEGLKSLLADDFDLVGIVEDGGELVPLAKTLLPDVVIADISMPNLSGIDALVQLKRDLPSIKVVFFTMHQDAVYARRAVAAGADGYVVKHSAAGELVLTACAPRSEVRPSSLLPLPLSCSVKNGAAGLRSSLNRV